jgi:hypothetical protein
MDATLELSLKYLRYLAEHCRYGWAILILAHIASLEAQIADYQASAERVTRRVAHYCDDDDYAIAEQGHVVHEAQVSAPPGWFGEG